MKYFDLHLHPVLKTLFKEPDNQVSAWETLSPGDAILGNPLESQCSLGQIADTGKMNLICMTWFPPEMGMVDQWLLRLLAPMYGQLDKSRLKRMASGEDDYRAVMKNELINLLSDPPPGYSQEILILRSIDEYDAGDMNTLHVFFNLEGGHIFYGDWNDNEHITEDSIKRSFDYFQKQGSILYLTPAHLNNNVFLNHAYGNKILSKKYFIPRGHGITSLGESLIRASYDRGILVDIKHMSAKSRSDFYTFRKKHYPDKPIVASHMGFVGCRWKDMPEYITKIKRARGFVKIKQEKKEGLLDGTLFNPNSINMYDEEIVEVIKSGGIIGISMDIRILGADGKAVETEFVSTSEFDLWPEVDQTWYDKKTAEGNNSEYPANDVDGLTWSKEDLEDQMEDLDNGYDLVGNDPDDVHSFQPKQVTKKESLHLRHFMNHLLHAVKIAKAKGFDAWDHLCIGSDFDGMVSALHCCSNVNELDDFVDLLRTHLPQAAQEAGIQLPDMNSLLKKLFHDNAVNFVQQHLKPALP